MKKHLPASILAALTLLFSGISAAGGQGTPEVAIRLDPGGLDRAGVEATFSARYGAFDWAVVPTDDLAALRRAGVAFQIHPEAGRLVLPSASFDPLEGVPEAT